MALTFEVGLAIGLAYSIFVAIVLGVTALRINSDWSETCERLDREWQQLATRIVLENYKRHVIEGR